MSQHIQAWQVLGRPWLIMPMDAGEGKIELLKCGEYTPCKVIS